MLKWIILFLAGGVGTISRYLLSTSTSQFLGDSFPYGTLLVNSAGCLLIGFLSSLFASKSLLQSELFLFLVVGFLGAFTTFSSLIFETTNLLKANQLLLAWANIIVSITLGFVFFYLGSALAKVF